MARFRTSKNMVKAISSLPMTPNTWGNSSTGLSMALGHILLMISPSPQAGGSMDSLKKVWTSARFRIKRNNLTTLMRCVI